MLTQNGRGNSVAQAQRPMEGSEKPVTKTPEQIEEEKLKSRYGNLINKGPALLEHRLKNKNKFFDSGDYNMAKARGVKQPNPMTMCNTGDTIPTPDNVPAMRKKSVSTTHQQQQQHMSTHHNSVCLPLATSGHLNPHPPAHPMQHQSKSMDARGDDPDQMSPPPSSPSTAIIP